MLGLERALLPLGRSTDILPQVRAALAAHRRAAPIYGVALRAWAAADEPDSLRVVAERWAAAAPGDETPYREWGAAALGRRDRPGAAAAYRRAASSCTGPTRWPPSWPSWPRPTATSHGASREWLPAIRRLPGYRATAVSTLSQAPDSLRPDLLAPAGA